MRAFSETVRFVVLGAVRECRLNLEADIDLGVRVGGERGDYFIGKPRCGNANLDVIWKVNRIWTRQNDSTELAALAL